MARGKNDNSRGDSVSRNEQKRNARSDKQAMKARNDKILLEALEAARKKAEEDD